MQTYAVTLFGRTWAPSPGAPFLCLALVSYLEPPLTQEQSHYAVPWFPTPQEGVPKNPVPCSVPALSHLPGLLEVGATRAC